MGKGVVLLAGMVLAGCAAPGERASGGGDADLEGLAISVEANVGSDSVRLLMHLTNTGDDAMEFRFRSSQRYDFVVDDSAGERVWRWSDGMAFTQALAEAELAPGETWDFEAAWSPGGREGVHRVTGLITARDRDVRQSTTFEIP